MTEHLAKNIKLKIKKILLEEIELYARHLPDSKMTQLSQNADTLKALLTVLQNVEEVDEEKLYKEFMSMGRLLNY